jgi:hypothetical protein
VVDEDLAELYGVPTYRLNEQVKRNRNRFPKDFMFRLTKVETESGEEFGARKTDRFQEKLVKTDLTVRNLRGQIQSPDFGLQSATTSPSPLWVAQKRIQIRSLPQKLFPFGGASGNATVTRVGM